MSKAFATALAAATMFVAGAASAHVATISGGYDLDAYDTPELIFHNTSAFDFTNAQIVLTGYNGVNNGKTQTLTLPTIGAGSDLTVIWASQGVTSASAGPFWQYDYDDQFAGQYADAPGCPANPINSGLCGQPGNFYVTFTAKWDGLDIFSQFSPDSNATGGFVPWIGLNEQGYSEDPCCDVHSGSVTGDLAYIDVGLPPPITGVPEPATIAVLGLGLAGLGIARRRRS